MKHKRLSGGVFDVDVHAMHGTRAEINAFFKRKHGIVEEISPGFKGVHQVWIPNDPMKQRLNYVCVVQDATPNTRYRRGVLIHEIVHAALDIFDHKGVKYNGDNDEHLAYFIEWLYNECEVVL